MRLKTVSVWHDKMEHTSLYLILLMSAYIYSGHTQHGQAFLGVSPALSGDPQSESEVKPHPVLSVSPARWLNVGDSVTLRCELEGSSSGWRFYWYREVYDGQRYSTELLPDSERGAGGSYSVSSVGLSHTGLYSCRAGRGDPVDYTDYSYKLLWVAGLSPPASLTISPNRSQFFEGESVSVSCEVEGNSSGWRVVTITHGNWLSECPSVESSTGRTCTLRVDSRLDYGVLWCESGSGEYSNAVNITVTHPECVLSVSPARWLNVGDSVTLRCEVEGSSSGWRFYWYRTVYDRGQHYSTELLPDSERGAGGSYSVSSVGLNHTGLYLCRAGREDTVYFSDYSPHPLWVAGLSPPASLTISPNRSQFFHGESVSVSCEVEGNSAGWRVMRIARGYTLSECPSVQSSTGPTCTLPSVIETHDSGLFWCESGSGEYSNAVNITVTAHPDEEKRSNDAIMMSDLDPQE